MKNSSLSDGSQIIRFTRLEMSRAAKLATIVFAEAVTTKGEHVIVSTGTEGYIGRNCDESHPATEFHLLDVRYKFPYWQLNSHCGVGAAIDEEGEVWILCSAPETNFYKLDPSCSGETADEDNRCQTKPFRTTLMAESKCRALDVLAGHTVITVTTQGNEEDHKVKPRILVFNADEKYSKDKQNLQKMLDKYY